MEPNLLVNSNQLQNHPKFIIVHGTWSGRIPCDTMNGSLEEMPSVKSSML